MRFTAIYTCLFSFALLLISCDYMGTEWTSDVVKDATTETPKSPADSGKLPTPADLIKVPVPSDSTPPKTTVDTLKPPLPADTAKPVIPADTTKPVTPIDSIKPPLPADTVKVPAPVDTVKPPLPVDTLKVPNPVDTTKPPVPVDTIKVPVPVDTTKGTVPVDTVKPTLPPLLLLRSDLEDQTGSCWGSGGPCGVWSSIGGSGARLAEGQSRGTGTKSLSVTFSRNEEVAGASLPISAEVVNVRAWYNFAAGFDFGQGVKIGRLSSFNSSTQMNDIDIIMTVRSAGSVNQCGLTDMADLGLFFNGRPVGYDWGNITAYRKFERGRWYAIEYQVVLNAPGQKNGSVKLWVDGVLAAGKTGINIRGSGGSAVKMNRLRIGGWYSNGANGNGCTHPSQPSTMYVDDVAVGTGYIGVD